jgi:hypothetical protein
MSDIGFTPDESLHIHEEGAIQLLCANFRSHEAGLLAILDPAPAAAGNGVHCMPVEFRAKAYG